MNSTFENHTSASSLWCHQSHGIFLFLTLLFLPLLMMLLGIVGNILAFVVLQTKYPKNVTHFLLKVLTGIDGLFSLLAFLTTFLQIGMVNAIQHYVVPVLLVLQLASIWQTVFIGLYRFTGIYKPYYLEKFGTMKNVCIAESTIIILSVILNIPTYIINNKMLHSPTSDLLMYNEFLHYIVYNHSQDDLRNYMIFLFGFVYFLVPLIMLMILNVGMMKAVCSTSDLENKGEDSLSKQNREITKTVIGILFVFILTYIPFFFAIIGKWLRMDFISENKWVGDYCGPLMTFLLLFGVFPFISCSVNWIIYVITMKSFKKNYTELCCACCPCCKTSKEETDEMGVIGTEYSISIVDFQPIDRIQFNCEELK